MSKNKIKTQNKSKYSKLKLIFVAIIIFISTIIYIFSYINMDTIAKDQNTKQQEESKRIVAACEINKQQLKAEGGTHLLDCQKMLLTCRIVHNIIWLPESECWIKSIRDI